MQAFDLDLFSLRGKTALVSGASSGIGAEAAAGLARAGARVVVGARRTEHLDALVEQIVAEDGEAFATHLDVTDRTSVAAAFDEAESRFGRVGQL